MKEMEDRCPEKMTYRTICPESSMDIKEGLYLFITLMWGILILLSDYRHTGPLIHGIWISFGFLLIFTSIYIWFMYCIFPYVKQMWSEVQYFFFSFFEQKDVHHRVYKRAKPRKID